MTIARHTAYNLVASLAPVIVSLATIPAQIHYLGEARFGILAIFALLLGYFGIFDLGVSRAIAQRIAAVAGADLDERRTIFGSGLAINIAMGSVGGLVLLPLALWFFGTQMKAPPDLHGEMLVAAGWLAVAAPVGLLTQVLRGALQAGERFGPLNLIGAIGNVSSQLLPLAAAIWWTPSLTLVLPVLFLTRMVTLLAFGRVVLRDVLGGRRPRVDRTCARDLLSFGGWVALSGFVAPLMSAFDRVLIGSMIGARAISHYTVPYQLGERAMVLPIALTDAIFPRIAARDERGARDMARRALAVISAVMTPVMVTAIVCLKIFLSLWINPAFAQEAANVGAILFAGFCFNASGIALYVSLQAGGKPRMVAIAHLIEVLPFFAMLWLGLHFWGLAGAAAASALRVTLDMLLLAHFAGLGKFAFRLSLIPGLMLAAALVVGPSVELGSLGGLAAGAAVIALSCGFALLRLHSQGFSLPAFIAAKLRARAAA
ncbi:MAG: flippase [Pseudomonadota bacterium]